MAIRSTVYQVVETQLNEQGTSVEVLVPDLLDSGHSYEQVTDVLRERTHVPLSSRTVRRWVEKLEGSEEAA